MCKVIDSKYLFGSEGCVRIVRINRNCYAVGWELYDDGKNHQYQVYYFSSLAEAQAKLRDWH